jgi:hypothetical protein
MFDVLICTNLVNYAVAMRGVRPGAERPALLLYEPWRFESAPMRSVWQLPIGIWSLRLVRLLVALRVVHTLYLPHDRFNWRVGWCRDRARRVAYLDDGLDTHRRQPVNFNLDRASPAAAYYTFDEFRDLPPWLARFDVRRAGSVAALATIAARPPLPLDGVAHVFVESPGLDVAGLIAQLGLPMQQVLVVRHPVPAKRGALPEGCRQVQGNAYSIEATLQSSQGLHWYFGETMALVFALHGMAQQRHRVFAQLAAAQRDNLVGLPLRAAAAPVSDLYVADDRVPRAEQPG